MSAWRAPSFNRRRDLLTVLVAVTVVALRVLRPVGMPIEYAVLAAYALRGRMEVLHAFGLSWLTTMLNEGLAPLAPGAAGARYLVVAAGVLSVTARAGRNSSDFRITIPVGATLSLGVFIAVHSLFISPMWEVSILKVAAWTAASATMMSAWGGLNKRDARTMVNHMQFGLGAVLAASAPMLFTPVGYLRNGTGFQGILNHPQVLGATMALLSAWSIGKLLGSPLPTWRGALLVASSAILVVQSQARTAGLALAGGVACGMLLVATRPGKPLQQQLPGLYHSRLRMLAFSGFIALVAAAPLLSSFATAYLRKGADAGSALDLYELSRGQLIRNMAANIRENPLLGIGFGIASEPANMTVTRDQWLGLPTGAAVEKGVMPLAILEELGAIGALLVAGWVFMVVSRAREGGVAIACVVLVAILTNLGEATLFSAGGMGLLVLATVTSVAAPSTEHTPP